MAGTKRCQWVPEDNPLYVRYHDEQWGVPVHDDRLLLEMLCLEGAQAGLSWVTILKKRDNYLKAFDRFDARKIAKYDQGKLDALMSDPGIVRNRLKIASVLKNAQAFLRVQKAHGSFAEYLWRFTGGTPIVNRWTCPEEIPVETEESRSMSKDLKKRGFAFVGPTICYSFMQAVGMVNDHVIDCFRYKRISELLSP